MSVQSKCVKVQTADFHPLLSARSTLSWLLALSFVLVVLTAPAHAAQVTLSWQDPNNDPAEVGGYNLRYWQDGQTPAVVNVGDTLSYTLTGLNAGSTYHFATTAHDGNGGRESAFSNEVTHTIPPDPPALSASFSTTPVSGPAPLMVTFADTSTGTITSWSWDFGDGGSSTAQHPAHTYTTAGTYTVSLTVTASGSTDTATATVTATPAGNGSMTLVEADFSSGAAGFGYVDDAFRNTSQPAYAAGSVNSGNLQVTLGGLDNNAITGMSGGWRTSFTVPGSTPAAVTLSFAYNLTQDPNYENDEYSEVLVTVGSLQPGNNGADYVARIAGDGNGGNAVSTGWQTFTTTLSLNPGTYTLTLGSYNNKKTYSDETTTVLLDDVIVQADSQVAPLVAAFSAAPPSGTAPLAVTFTDTSTGTISSHSWDFGDGGSSTAQHHVHTYTTPGTYTVTLTVTGPGGSDTATTSITAAAGTDTDGDGLTDAEEELYGTNPTMADTDHDGINDGDEVAFWGNNWNVNYDNDAIANNLLDPDADNDGYADGLELHYGSVPGNANSAPALTDIMATGEVQINHTWQRVTFTVPFLNPVVVATPLSHNDPDPAVVRIRNVSSTGFDVRLQEWDYLDDSHAFETVYYTVMESGRHTLSNGTQVEAGTRASASTSFQNVSFTQPFQDTPVVITSIVTMNEADAVTGRVRNVNLSRFHYRLQEQELNTQTHATESISYIAWEPFAGAIDGLTVEVGRTADVVRHDFYSIAFDAAFTDSPVFLADMQKADGSDTANLRWRNKGPAGVEVQADEEQSKDNETNHTTEVVGYIAVQ